MYSDKLTEFIIYFKKTFYNNDIISPFYDLILGVFIKEYKKKFQRPLIHSKGWHTGFNRLVGIKNPNLGRFIEAMRPETEKIRTNIARYLAGDFDLMNVLLLRKKNLKFMFKMKNT